MSEPYMGQIQPFGFYFAPRGWAQCNGQQMTVQQNSALFALLGVQFGGNGTTNFLLPNLQGRTMIHTGTLPGGSAYTMGEAAGTEKTTLLTSNMPQHNHSLTAVNVAGENNTPSGMLLAQAVDANLAALQVYAPASSGAPVSLAPQAIGPSGGSQPFSILQPFLVVNVCIAMQGIFPSRN